MQLDFRALRERLIHIHVLPNEGYGIRRIVNPVVIKVVEVGRGKEYLFPNRFCRSPASNARLRSGFKVVLGMLKGGPAKVSSSLGSLNPVA